MTGTLWEGLDETMFYVVERVAPHGWRVINLTGGVLDYLWAQDDRMHRHARMAAEGRNVIGSLWHMDSKRNPWLYVVVCDDDSYPDFKGWKLLELTTGDQVYAYDAGENNICLINSDEPLYRFEP